MSVVKSNILKQLSNQYKNYLKKDLSKILDITLNQIKLSLKKGESVELRGFGRFTTKIHKKKYARNPKTGEKVFVPEKKNISFRMAKEAFKKINEKK